MARDHWNDVQVKDEEALLAQVIAICEKAKPFTYSEIQELRNCSDLCDRSHFQYEIKRLCDKTGEAYPKELDIIMEDPDFDLRNTFMKNVVKAVDPLPTKPRVRL